MQRIVPNHFEVCEELAGATLILVAGETVGIGLYWPCNGWTVGLATGAQTWAQICKQLASARSHQAMCKPLDTIAVLEGILPDA